MEMIADNFGMELKKDCLMFKYNKSTYKIPSKIYPLNNGKRSYIFASKNTKEINNAVVEKLFNACHFQNGKCYANSEMLKQGAEHLNVKGLKYYSGWVFMGYKPPLNHAWIVYDNDSILDGSLFYDVEKIFYNLNHEKTSKQEYANILKKALIEDKLNSKKFCFGKVPQHLIYVGCEDTYEHARALFKKALDITKGKHPSYIINSGMNPYGKSELQRMMSDSI